MRYMLLIYSREDEAATAEHMSGVADKHRALIEEARESGILHGADPLASSVVATTVRVNGDSVLLTDGPFAETKEQLAVYYVLDCKDLDEAIKWASRIPTGCFGGSGCVEIRPLRYG